MSPTLSRVLISLTAGALLGGATAHAEGKRVVVLDFDGPRTWADSGRDAVVRAVGVANDLVAQKKWNDAKSAVARTKYGPKMWNAASKEAGVDAVIEGWVQVEARSKVLTVVVTDATTGNELDQLTLKLGNEGITETTLRALRKELELRLEWVKDPPPKIPELPPVEPAKTTTPPASEQPPPAETPAPATPAAPKETAVLDQPTTKPLEPDKADWIVAETKRVLGPAPRVRVGGGFGWTSRSLNIGAEEDGTTPYSGVPAKSIGVDAAFYPFPRNKRETRHSGVGFSFGVSQSIGNTVTFDDLEEVGEYSIDQHSWNAAVHYRTLLGDHFAIDGEVGYSRQTYNLEDAPETFEVPNTSYHALHAGGHLDLSVTDRASVGFGGKYFHVLETGDLTSTEWYGPGNTSGLSVDANFVIPLPARMFVGGKIEYSRFKTSFDGVGVITEEEGVYEAVDSNVGINVRIGVDF